MPTVASGLITDAISLRPGRQLFVNDDVIDESSLVRSFHRPEIHPASPVLVPETPLEMNNGYCPVACPFQDGVFYDPADRLFKMFYHAGWFDGTAIAYSEDGVRWWRPDLDVEPGTNRILPHRHRYFRDGAGMWLDHEAKDPSERFKMFIYFRKAAADRYRYGEPFVSPPESEGGSIYTSADGIHWNFRSETGPCGDNTNFFYNPCRKTWVYSIRTKRGLVRERSFRECADFVEGARWTRD